MFDFQRDSRARFWDGRFLRAGRRRRGCRNADSTPECSVRISASAQPMPS